MFSLKRAPRRSIASCRSGVFSILRCLAAWFPALGYGRVALSLLSVAALGGHAWSATCAPATSGGSAPADWPSYCWFDFSSYSDATARSAAGQSFTFTLNDGSTLSFTVNVSSSNTTALTAVTAPAWSGAAVGNTAFLGIPGKPILYTAASGTATVKFSGITLTRPAGVSGGSTYSFVAADGESTNSGESVAFTTNGANWTILDKVPPISGSLYPTIANTGTTFTETGAAGTVGGYIVGSTSATTVSTTLVAGGLQGAMFALRYSAISLNKKLVGGRVNPADQFTYSISATSSGSTLGTGTSTGTGNGPFNQTSSFITTQQSLTLTEGMSSGSVSSLANYSPSLTCTNSTAGSTTALPTAVATTSYVLPTIAFGDVIACTFTNTIVPPVLSITKSAPSPGLQVGTNSVYTLTVTNSGHGPATTAQVKDQLPGNLNFVSAVGSGWSCSNASSLVTCAYSGNIPVGGTSTIAVTVSAPAAAAGASDTNYASIDPTSGTSAPAPGATCTTAGSCASAGPNTVIYINPAADTGTAPAGTASTAIVNVAANDAVNGAAATLGASGNATVAPVGTWSPGLALNATTGAVTTTAAVLPGTYSVQYQLCDKNSPANCATTTDTVTVTAAVLPVADTGTAVAGTASTPIANVAANDTVNGAAVVLTGVAANATIATVGTWTAGISLNPTTGAVTTTAAVVPGAYSLQYQLCDKNTPANCATATDTVTVTAAIVAVAESGTAIAATAATPIANVAANDTVNGSAASLGPAGNATVAQSGTWAAGIVLNTTSGAITTTAAVAPGTYSVAYQLCDKNTPANCATTTDTVTVTASIVAVADTGSAVAGTASTPIANVASNDTVNGAAASLGSAGNATVAPVGTWAAGLALNAGTGAITTTSAVGPGSYTLQYQLCDKNTPANCTVATDTVTVTAAIVATADTGSAVSGTASTPIANVAANDTVNGAAATLGSAGNATVLPVGTWAAGIALNASTGAVTTTATVAPGSYGVQYQLCDKNTPANCATTTDSVTVTAAIVPVADSGTAVAGSASTPIVNVAANDTVNGAAATLGSAGNATLAQSGTWITGITLNTSSGAISTSATVGPGSYSVAYQLCDKNTPANCATVVDIVTVAASILPAADAGTAVAGTVSTPIANVAANDTVNGAAATLGSAGNATVAQAGTWTAGFALNAATGAITMTAAVPPGSYTLQYELCDKATPPNCATATDNVTVSASIVPVADTGTAVAGTASTAIANVAANDSVNGAAATLGSTGNATVAQSGTWPGGIALNGGNGAVTVTAAVAPGTYSLLYQLCDKSSPANCATMTDTVTVTAVIAAVADSGTAVAGTASTAIANVATNDTVNGAAAVLGASGNATVARVGTWTAGIALNTASGAITTTAAVPPGSYSEQYQLCDKSTPVNCATTTDTVTVTGAIAAVADAGTAVAGTAGTPIANVAANDTVNGAAATLGSAGNATVATVGTWAAGIALNASTGAVTTTAAVAPGSYSLQYQLCDKNTPVNCATTTDTVAVTASIVATADAGTATAGTASTAIANVAVNDWVNGAAAVLSGAAANATVAMSGAWPAGLTLNAATGAITTAATLAPGVYSVAYRLCDKNTPPNCALTTDSVTVTASIVPVADTGSAVAGTASTPIANVAANDTVNGTAAVLSGAAANASVAQSGTWPMGVVLNAGTGAVTITAGVAPGAYSVVYQLCDKKTPANCAVVTDTVTVTASILPVADAGTVSAGSGATAIANVAANDSVNGAAAVLTGAAANASVTMSGSWPAGMALNTGTGAITVGAAVAPGVYSVQYQLCDKDTPVNCAAATDTVTVTASIVPVADTGTAVAGTASTPVANVAANDLVNGAAAVLTGASANATVAQFGTWTSGIALNPATGAITVTGAVLPGSYSLTYQLCDKNTPAHCATATDTITVTASILPGADTGSATAGVASTPVANVAANDSINGSAAVIEGAGTNATVSPSGPWPSGLALNAGTGAVTITAAVAPGTYSVVYQLCDKNTPPDCATATATVTVKAAIAPTAETGSAVAGTASTPIANVAANDTVNGAAVVLSGTGANATVAQVGTWPTGIALNGTTGAVSTTTAAAAGTFSLQYQLCDKNSPANCATATDTVTINDSIVIKPDPGTAVAGIPSTPIANVAAGATVNGQLVTLGSAGNSTVSMAGTWPVGVVLNAATGAVSTTAAVPPGTYSFQYRLCAKAPPGNCVMATDSIVVTPNIVPAAYQGSAAAGTASTPIATVAVNDTVNGVAAVLGPSGNATVSPSGTWPAGFALSATGAVTVTAAVAPNTYSLSYQLCDKNSPANCATAILTIKVSATVLPATASGTAVAGTAATPIANVAANGTVDGQAATLGAGGNATVAEVGTWPTGVVLNTATGAVTMSAAVLPGTYPLGFQLCDTGTPPSCATATDTLVVKNTVGGSLVIDKSASKSQAEVGDSIQYRIHVRNPGTAPVIAVRLNDTLPLGFQLIPGSVLMGVNGATPTAFANPQGMPGPQLVWPLGNVAAAEIVEIDYRVRVAAGAERGSGINKAQAVGDGVTSSVAAAQVQVTGGAFDTSACVVGKVYVDCNGNRVQDVGEPGIPGVRLYFEDGTNLTSDENGNYSICGQRPITHVLKVDSTTLPAGSRMVVVSSRNAGDGDSLFVDLRDGELHRADFAEGSCTDKVMQDVKRRRLHGPLLSPLPAAGREHMGVDFESLPNGDTRINVPPRDAAGAPGSGGAATATGPGGEVHP